MDIRKFIERRSKSENIDAVGFTNTYDEEHIKETLISRKNRGMNTEFDDIPIEDRIYPEKLLKGYKTIVSFALSYNFGDYSNGLEDSYRSGILSKCSIGVDYHTVLREKIGSIMEEVKRELDIDYIIGVDTSPLLDREIARSSGIGYFGKNTNIINREYGSFIFLGYALIDTELDNYDSKIEETCGVCDICSRACPTNSINGDYTINTRTCIAYLTQTKSKIPYNLRVKMDKKIYGCDTCQNACPKNISAKIKDVREFEPLYVDKNIDLMELIDISNREFKSTYGKTSSGWRGKNVLRRNAIIAMGNIGDSKYLSILERLLSEESDMIREYSIWSLLRIDLQEGKTIVNRNREKLKETDLEEYSKVLRYMGVI